MPEHWGPQTRPFLACWGGHVHLLVSEPRRQTLSVAIKALKQAMARRVLGSWRRKCRQQGELFPGDSMPQRFWVNRGW